MEFEFERRRITKEDVRELIYREILEYHPKMLKEYLDGSEPTGFMYPRYLKNNSSLVNSIVEACYVMPLSNFTLNYQWV